MLSPKKLTQWLIILAIAAIALSACSLLPGQAPAATPTRAPQATPLVAAPTATIEVPPPPTNTPVVPTPTPAVLSSATKAAGLRVALDRLLGEHVLLAASTTAAALANRAKDFESASAALDANSVDLSKAIGALHGDAAEKSFLTLWRKRVGLIVDYTAALATKDKAKQDKAQADLSTNADDVGAFFNSANPNLAKAALADALKENNAALKSVIDAQAANDFAKAYDALHNAFAQTDKLALAIAVATAKQFPDKYDGTADSAGAGLRANLTLLFTEHAYLVSAATGAGMSGRAGDFNGAANALTANSAAISQSIGSLYGPANEKSFGALWLKHVGLFVDYAGGTITKDKAKQDKAVADLNTFSDEFGALLNSLSPNLPKAAVFDLTKTHVATLKDVIDAQAASDYAKAYPALRKAYAHMSLLADPLADAIVKQFPDKFR